MHFYKHKPQFGGQINIQASDILKSGKGQLVHKSDTVATEVPAAAHAHAIKYTNATTTRNAEQ